MVFYNFLAVGSGVWLRWWLGMPTLSLLKAKGDA